MSTDDEFPEWPAGIDLPAGQLAMTHADWIDYLDPIIESFDESPYEDHRIEMLVAIRDWHVARIDDD